MIKEKKDFLGESLRMRNPVISFTLSIDPLPKGRPRLGSRGNVYTPPQTRRYENDLQMLMLPYRPKKPIEGPVILIIHFFLKRPKKQKHASPTGRPDIDNLTKSVMDSMNGIFWLDDSQVVYSCVSKHYAIGRSPGIDIEIQ